MMWMSVKEDVPLNDQTVLGRNKELENSFPILCYYDEDAVEFYGIYDSHGYPLVITHWMEIPPFKPDGGFGPLPPPPNGN